MGLGEGGRRTKLPRSLLFWLLFSPLASPHPDVSAEEREGELPDPTCHGATGVLARRCGSCLADALPSGARVGRRIAAARALRA